MFLAVFANLGGAAPFSLASQNNFTQRLRKYRCYQGGLQSNKLPSIDLQGLQERLRESSDTMKSYATDSLGANTKNMLSAILDSGCTYTAFNSFEWVDPKSIRRLSEPIQVGGIAGSLNIEFFGTAHLEVLLPSGKVLDFPVQGVIHESLPQVLLSPQAFLAQNHGGRVDMPPEEFLHQEWSPSEYEQHFRIFHNRTEWHKDGHKLLDLKYDSSFLPRITLFKKGSALDTAKGLHAAFKLQSESGAVPLTHAANANLSFYKKLLSLWHA